MFKKRMILLLAAMTTLLLLASASLVAADASRNRTVAVVNGRTQMSVPLSEFGLDLEGNADMDKLFYQAQLKADGSVSGHYFYQITLLGTTTTYSGRMYCLKVDGNRAWIGATVDKSSNPDRVGLYSWWQVEDNARNSADDRSTFVGFGTEQETIDYCEGPAPNFIFEIDRGNVAVVDHQ